MSPITLASEPMTSSHEELTAPSAREQLGQILRARREELGLNVSVVVKTTCIRSSIIHALEQGQFEKIGSETYIKGFIKTYAHFLSLSPDTLLELYEVQPVIEKYVHPFDIAFPTPTALAPSKKLLFVCFLSLAVLFIVFMLYDQHMRTQIRAPEIDLSQFVNETEKQTDITENNTRHSNVFQPLVNFGDQDTLLKKVNKSHREYHTSENVILSPIEEGWVELYQDDALILRSKLTPEQTYIFHKEPNMALITKNGNWMHASYKGKTLNFQKSLSCDDHLCEFTE